jgi:SulP family sulfate permease
MQKSAWVPDLRAAAFGVFLTLPQAVAFAALGHMPVAAAIWASFIPALIASLIGREAFVITGPSAMLSLMLGTTLSQHVAPGSPEFLASAAMLVAMMAVFQALAAATGFVQVLRWIPPPAVRGITGGIGVSILLSQLPVITGVQGIPAILPLWSQALSVLHATWHPWPLLSFAFTLFLGWALRIAPWAWMRVMRWPVAVMLSSLLVQHPDIAVIGRLSLSMPQSAQALLHPGVVVASSWPEWIGPALTFAALALTQSLLVSEGAALRGHTRMNIRRESWAQAAANLGSALLCAFPVSASVNRSLAHEKAGARTWISGVMAAVAVMAVAVVATPLVALLAMPALAALLSVVAWGMLRGAFAKDRRRVSLAFGMGCVFLGMGWSVLIAIVYGLRHFHPDAVAAAEESMTRPSSGTDPLPQHGG